MNVKIECACGARYSFEVEPREGRMPGAVQCPVCHADGTEAANQIIAAHQTAASPPGARLRIQVDPNAAAPGLPAATEAEAGRCPRHPGSATVDFCAVCGKAICPECLAAFGYLCSVVCRYEAERTGIEVPVYRGQKRLVEDRKMRKGLWLAASAAVLLSAALGTWGWYAFVGSRPHLAAAMKVATSPPARAQFLGADKILIVNAEEATARDLSLKKAFWTTKLGGRSAARPQVFVARGNLWICAGQQVFCLDQGTGVIKQTIPIVNQIVSFTPSEAGILVVSAKNETERTALHIEPGTGASSSQEIIVPRAEKHAMPNELPPNVQPTAAVLLAQALDEQKFNKPLDAESSEFFSAGENLVELRVKLLEPIVTTVQSIKPRTGPSRLNGQTTAGSAAGPIAEEMFNDLKRSETGGVRQVDESLYEVKVRRWLDAQAPEPVEWTGNVNGAPSFFPLNTVDLLAAGKTLIVFDKQNKKLFESKLSYPVSERFTTRTFGDQAAPGVERGGMLYFFDEGVLTAFALPAGDVRWRLTSVAVTGIHFDEQGMLYVDSTAAAPEDIQYSDTISIEKTPPMLLKVEPGLGKILWRAKERGQYFVPSGKFLYAASVEHGGLGIGNALRDALAQPAGEGPVYFHLYRIDPATGEEIWDLYREEGPSALAVTNNRILLQFGDQLQLYKFLAF